jgi:RHS repeat-associated protein
LTYEYDAVGNRTRVGGTWARTGLPQALASATYDAANQIATWAGTTFSYDPNGNLASDGLTSYLWNARSQLTGLSGGTSAGFGYDGLGRRRTKTVRGVATSVLYDGVNTVQELAGGSPAANLLTGGIDEVFQRQDGIGARAFMTDALGSTLALADGSGFVQTSYTYAPFGETTVSGTTSANPTQFTGRESDLAHLYYYRSRHYAPQLHRFISEDAGEFSAGDPNLHAYVSNRPTALTDPSGRFAVPLLLCAAGAGGSAAADWLSRRKFDVVRAASWCVGGLTLGFMGPTLAASWGAAGGSAGAGAAATGASEAMRRALERQLAQHGTQSLERSLRSFEQRVAEHMQKLQQVREAGGHTTSIEREIQTFQRHIEAIRDLLARRGGLQ